MDILFRGGYGSSSCYFWPDTCLFVCCLAGSNIYEINIIRMTSKYQSNLRSLKTLRIAVGFWLSLEPNAGQRGLWMTEFSQAYERGGQRSTWKWGQGGFFGSIFGRLLPTFLSFILSKTGHFSVLKCSFWLCEECGFLKKIRLPKTLPIAQQSGHMVVSNEPVKSLEPEA